MEYRDTRLELRARLRKDLNIPVGEIGDAILVAVEFCIDQGFTEMAPLIDRYGDLLCPWCGRLHHDPECL